MDKLSICVESSPHGQRAKAYFLEGYNCSQSVVLAFCEEFNWDKEMMLKLSSSFGGGMARLREVCGAVSGMFIVAGALYGYDQPKDVEGKTSHYKRIQELAEEYRIRNGSIVCREILGLKEHSQTYVPEARTKEYYKKRPCPDLVAMAAAIMEKYIEENPITEK